MTLDDAAGMALDLLAATTPPTYEGARTVGGLRCRRGRGRLRGSGLCRRSLSDGIYGIY